MWQWWSRLGLAEKTCASAAIGVLALDTIFMVHALFTGTYEYLSIIFEESLRLLAKIGLFFAAVKIMNSFIPKSAWFCEATITLYSILLVACFGVMADTFVKEVELHKQSERIDNMNRYIALIFLIIFFHYWRTEAKNSLLAKEPQTAKEPPPLDKSAVHAIFIIVSTKLSLFAFYYFQSENLSNSSIRIGFMAIAVLFLLLIDIMNSFRAYQASFPLNETLLVVSAVVMMIFATAQLTIPIVAFTINSAIVYRPTFHIISVLTIIFLLFFLHVAVANEHQRKKKEEEATRLVCLTYLLRSKHPCSYCGNMWGGVKITEEERSARLWRGIGSILIADALAILHAVLFSDYRCLLSILATSFASIAAIGLLVGHVNLMHWLLSKFRWFCDVTITVCSVMSVAAWCGIAELFAEQDELYRTTGQMNYRRAAGQSVIVVLLLIFFHHWRTAAKIKLRAKIEDRIGLSAHSVEKAAVYAILGIASFKAAILTHYYVQAEYMSIMQLRIEFMTIGILFLALSDVLDNIRATLAFHSLNQVLRHLSAAAVVGISFVLFGLQHIGRADVLSRSTARICSIIIVICMLLCLHFEATKEEQEAITNGARPYEPSSSEESSSEDSS